MPRQADPIIPDNSQRREQLQKEAQEKLAQSQAISDQQENTRRATLRSTAQKKAQGLHLTISDKHWYSTTCFGRRAPACAACAFRK